MPDPAIQAAKRRQALGIAAFLVAVTLATSGLYRLVHPDALAWRRAEQARVRADHTAAADHYLRARELGFTHPELLPRLADALVRSDRPALALDLLRQHLATHPDPALRELAAGLAQSLDDPATALALFGETGPRDTLSPAQLVRRADLEQHAGDLPAAIASLRAAIDRVAPSADLHAALGHLLARDARHPESLAAFQAALDLDPAHRSARLGLARVLSWQGRHAESAAAYQAYLAP